MVCEILQTSFNQQIVPRSSPDPSAGALTADASWRDRPARLLSFHGSQWELLPSVSSLSDHIKSDSRSFFSSPSGASGEDQGLPKPFCCLSKWIEGLQHLTAAAGPGSALSSRFQRVSRGMFPFHHKNLCKRECTGNDVNTVPGREIGCHHLTPPTAPCCYGNKNACDVKKILYTCILYCIYSSTGRN